MRGTCKNGTQEFRVTQAVRAYYPTSTFSVLLQHDLVV
jgi:hypothetical protein